MKIIEVVIGNDLNEENEVIFNEFMDEFAEYIVMQSGPQTVLLGENFFANEEEITERMRVGSVLKVSMKTLGGYSKLFIWLFGIYWATSKRKNGNKFQETQFANKAVEARIK